MTYKDHPNLSLEVNANIRMSEELGGIWLKDLPEDREVLVMTAHSICMYAIRHDPEQKGKYLIRGGEYCPRWTNVGIHGSTFGGSMLKIGFVGLGMHLEFSSVNYEGETRVITTSIIEEIAIGATTYHLRPCSCDLVTC